MAKQIHCVECGFEGGAKTFTKGSFLIEIILWLCFLVPGVIYSLWRITSGRFQGCPDCSSERVIELSKWKKRNETNEDPKELAQ